MSGTEQRRLCHHDLSDAQRLGRLLRPGACASLCEGMDNKALHTTSDRGQITMSIVKDPQHTFILKPSVQHHH